MSKHETWRTIQYWESVGGLLILEYRVVRGSSTNGYRDIDGIIVLGERTRCENRLKYNVQGKDLICIQTKGRRIGMTLMGQALFSRELLLGLGAKSVKTVAVCKKKDSVLEPLCEKYGIEVVEIPDRI